MKIEVTVDLTDTMFDDNNQRLLFEEVSDESKRLFIFNRFKEYVENICLEDLQVQISQEWNY